MPFEHFYFQSNHLVTWHWPLQVGAFGDDLAALSPGYWTHFLTTVRTRNIREKHDLVLMTGDRLAPILSWLYSGAAFDADVIAILVNKDTIRQTGFSPQWTNTYKLCRLIAERKGASGIFILATELPLSEWVERLVVELSHNNNVIEALKKGSTEGYCIYDIKLEKETRLTFLLQGLTSGLRSINFPPDTITTPIDYTLQTLSPHQLADYLEQSLLWGNPKELYNSEKRGASSIASVTKSLYPIADKLNFPIFHQDIEILPPKRTRGPAPHEHDGRAVPAAPPSRQPTPSPAPPSALELPRYLQARVGGTDGEAPGILQHSTRYPLQVRIGLPEASWSHGDMAFPDNIVFPKTTEQEEAIQLIFTHQGGEILQQKGLLLRPYINSEIVDFTFETPAEGTLFTGELYAYHKNRLLQKLRIEAALAGKSAPGIAPLGDAPSPGTPPPANHPPPGTEKGLRLKVVFCARKELNNLEARQNFGASLFYDTDTEKDGRLSGINDQQPLNLNIPKAMEGILQKIKDDIEDTVIDTNSYPQDLAHPNNVELLKKLAYKGNLIFVNHLQQMELKGPLQIVTSRNEFIPLDLVYTFPPPDPNGGLCPNAIAALQEGACRNCMDKHTSPAKFVCPFGFLGFSQVIERHTTEAPGSTNVDYTIKAEPSAGRDVLSVLEKPLYASSIKVGAADPTLETNILSCINKYSTQYAKKVDTWTAWTKITQTENPDTQILLVHVEPSVYDIDQIEIGTESLLQNLLDSTKIKPNPAQRSPFMIVIGCETIDLAAHGFDISSQLINYGAAIVLSNFTKIRGSQAGQILTHLVQLLADHPGKEMVLGEVVLRLKQILLSQGIMASLALIVQGDADWKIRTHV
ncbi:MAG: hypothetical protein J0H74_14755 [Chitinophagaceae bacterium]|nr:hypothetical protein [Chitinophagaceae bacterium]